MRQRHNQKIPTAPWTAAAAATNAVAEALSRRLP